MLAEYFESDYIHSVTRDTVKLAMLTTKWPVLAYISNSKISDINQKINTKTISKKLMY